MPIAAETSFILKLYPKYDLNQLDRAAILKLIQQDKKNAHNKICFTMLEQIGQFKINVHAEDALILEALDYYDAVL